MDNEYTLSNEQLLFLRRALNYTKDVWVLNSDTKRWIFHILDTNRYTESDRYKLTKLTRMIDMNQYYNEFMIGLT